MADGNNVRLRDFCVGVLPGRGARQRDRLFETDRGQHLSTPAATVVGAAREDIVPVHHSIPDPRLDFATRRKELAVAGAIQVSYIWHVNAYRVVLHGEIGRDVIYLFSILGDGDLFEKSCHVCPDHGVVVPGRPVCCAGASCATAESAT